MDLTNPKYYRDQEKTKLNLSCESLTDQDIQNIIIPFLNAHLEIETLDVSGNGLNDESAKALATKTSLATLDISKNCITDDRAKAFSISTNLKKLDVSWNRIGIRGLKALVSSTKIESLDILEGNNFDFDDNKEILAIYRETNPHARANHGRQVGIQSEVPSLLRLSLFKIQNTRQLYAQSLKSNLLLSELKDKIRYRPKV